MKLILVCLLMSVPFTVYGEDRRLNSFGSGGAQDLLPLTKLPPHLQREDEKKQEKQMQTTCKLAPGETGEGGATSCEVSQAEEPKPAKKTENKN